MYRGPYGHLPSVTGAMENVKKSGTYFSAKNGYSEYFQFFLKGQKYFIYPTPAGLEANLIHGEDPGTLHNAHIAYLACEEEDTGPFWWMELKSWRGENDQKYCERARSNDRALYNLESCLRDATQSMRRYRE